MNYQFKTVIAIISLLLLVNISQLFTSSLYSWLIAVACVSLLLLIAQRRGLSRADIGFAKRCIPKGFVWGGFAALVVAIILVLVFMVDHNAFIDSRYHNSFRYALVVALVIIPLRTVLVEELAFRGVLWANIRHMKGAKYATIVSSLLFGLWHIIPSLNLDQSSKGIGAALGSSSDAQILSIVGVVFVTSLTGLVLCELRRRSGSLIAPILAHWAINGGAVLLAALAWAH